MHNFDLENDGQGKGGKQEKYQNFDLENDGLGKGVEKLDLSHSTINVRFHIGDFFQNLLYMETYIYAKEYTHTHKHTHMETHTHTHTHTHTYTTLYVHTNSERRAS